MTTAAIRRVEVDTDNLSTINRIKENGIEFSEALSPYDLPVEVVGLIDTRRQTYEIEFTYIHRSTHLLTSKLSDRVTIFTDKNSGLIHRIEVPNYAKSPAVRAILSEMANEIGLLAKRQPIGRIRFIYEVIAQVIINASRQLE